MLGGGGSIANALFHMLGIILCLWITPYLYGVTSVTWFAMGTCGITCGVHDIHRHHMLRVGLSDWPPKCGAVRLTCTVAEKYTHLLAFQISCSPSRKTCSPENFTCSLENFTCSPENFTCSPQHFTSSPVKCSY